MYINNVHIFCYLIFAVLGGAIGQFLTYANKRLIDEKSIFSKEFFKRDKAEKKLNYPLIMAMAAIYVVILYVCQIQFDFIKDLKLIKYLILAPMLVSAFVIDYKLQIIPNRLNLTMFEVGLIFAFLYGAFVDLQIAKNMLLRLSYRSRNIPNNYFNWWSNCRQRSNGLWRRKTNGRNGALLWSS